MKRTLASAALATTLATSAISGTIEVKSDRSVAEAMDALVAAVTGAGATVFARIDHAGGAAKVDMELPDTQLLIFGNPALGTPAIQNDREAGLLLPLRVLVYQGADGTVIAYEDPATMLSGDAHAGAPYIAKMQGALKKLTGVAAGN
jgi:uncharacterized protein (DUF302 family)